jgi:preprotein translocase subunit SecB
MKATISPLVFLDFFILQNQYLFIEPNKNINAKTLFDKYDIDIDFDFRQNDEKQLLIFVSIGINNVEKHKVGYKIFTQGVALFNIEKLETLEQKDKDSLIFYSSLSIAINNLRNYISNLTVNSPLGKYNLPAIDVNDLHFQKKKEVIK